MLDIKYIKENPDEVVARLAKKGKDAKEDIEAILRLDAKRREIIAEVEAAKAELGGMVVEGIEAVNGAYVLIQKYDIHMNIIKNDSEISHNPKANNPKKLPKNLPIIKKLC